MKPRFTPTTFIAVILLLGVLVMAGRMADSAGKDDKKGGHSDEPTPEATKAPPVTAKPSPTAALGKDGKPQTVQLKPTADSMKPVVPTAERKKQMELQQEKMMAEAKKHGVKPGQAPPPDGMDPALWQDRDMGQVAPQPEVKKQ